MRLIILTIFAICMAGTVKAQNEFNFDCTLSAYNAEIAAIPDALYDADDDQSDNYDRPAYINEIIPPDGFSIYANDEKVAIHEGIYPGGIQRWPWGTVNDYTYEEWNFIYRVIHRVLINLKYGYEPNTGTGL